MGLRSRRRQAHRVPALVMTGCLVLGLPWAAAENYSRLTLAEYLAKVEPELAAVRRIELRQIEAREELNQLNWSRAFGIELDGAYREEDLDRLEVNGRNQKTGRLREYERNARLTISRRLLGRSQEERVLRAIERQRLYELEVERRVVEQRALLDAVSLYLKLAEEQQAVVLLEPAMALEDRRVDILTLRAGRGETLERTRLVADKRRAERRLRLTRSRRRIVKLRGDLNELVASGSLQPFEAVPIDWSALAGELESATGATGRSEVAAPLPHRPADLGEGVWFNLPEVNIEFGYEITSVDRHFADERRRERGHRPLVGVSVELPLDFFRSARSFRRHVEARLERRQLQIDRLQAGLRERELEASLALAEARAGLAAAAADEALQAEDLRVTRLRVEAGESEGDLPPEVALLDAELAAIDAKILVTEARGEVAKQLFEHQLAVGNGAVIRRLVEALSASRAVASSETGAPSGMMDLPRPHESLSTP